MSVLLLSISRKVFGMFLLVTSIHTIFLQRNISLFLFLRLHSLPLLILNVDKSSISFGHVRHPLQVWWSSKVKKAVRKRRKLLLPLTEVPVMKIARLRSQPLGMPRLSLPKQRLRNGRPHAHSLPPKSIFLSSALLLDLILLSPTPLAFPTVLLQGRRYRFIPTT